METSLSVPPLFAALDGARNVLLAGAGGGFDVYAALPLAVALRSRGSAVHLGNLSFTQLELLDLSAWAAPGVAHVGPDAQGPEDYFPERTLARWLATQDLPATVYAFAKVGVQPLRAAYQHLIDTLEIDAVVLLDGGTDILMRGDETGLGTPVEDMTSLAPTAVGAGEAGQLGCHAGGRQQVLAGRLVLGAGGGQLLDVDGLADVVGGGAEEEQTGAPASVRDDRLALGGRRGLRSRCGDAAAEE